jgi:hypothetical protein
VTARRSWQGSSATVGNSASGWFKNKTRRQRANIKRKSSHVTLRKMVTDMMPSEAYDMKHEADQILWAFVNFEGSGVRIVQEVERRCEPFRSGPSLNDGPWSEGAGFRA